MNDTEIIERLQNTVTTDATLKMLWIEKQWRLAAINFLTGKISSQEDREDIASIAFYKFYENIVQDKFKGSSSLKTYFIGIVKNTWLKHLRAREKDLRNLSANEIFYNNYGEYRSYLDQVITEETIKALDEALRKLGGICEQILRMRGRSLPYKKIIEIIPSFSSVKSLASRKRKCQEKIKKIIQETSSLG